MAHAAVTLAPMSPEQDLPVLPAEVLADLARTGDWLSSWVSAAVAGLFLLTFVILAVRARRARRHGVVRRAWPWWSLTALSTVVAVGFGVNAWVGYWPTTGALRMWAASNLGAVADTMQRLPGGHQGVVDRLVIEPDPADNMPQANTWTYLPPGYDPADPASVAATGLLVLFHGSPGSSADWFAAGDLPHTMDVLINADLLPPMVVAAVSHNGLGPGARDTECLDSTTGGSRVASHLEHTVLPEIARRYPTSGVRLAGGFSAGAFCALNLGLQQDWDGIVAITPELDPGDAGEAMLATQAEREANDLRHYLPTLPERDQPIAMVLARGTPDEEQQEIEQAAATMRERGREVLLIQWPGDHVWTTARLSLAPTLVWVCERLGLTAG